MRDQRWPFWPIIIIRPIQLVFSIIILGLTAYMTNESVGSGIYWFAPFGLTTALIATFYLIAHIVLYFRNMLLPLVVVIIDAFLLLFYLISVAGTGDAGFPSSSCKFYYYNVYAYSNGISVFCVVGKAAFALELLNMFLFMGTLALAAFILHKNKKDLRGKKYAAGNYDGGESAPDVVMETVAAEGKTEGVVPDAGVEYQTVPPQQIQTSAPYIPTPPPQQAVSPVYYQQTETQYPQQQQTAYDPNAQQQPQQQQYPPGPQYQQQQTYYPQGAVSPTGTPVQHQTAYSPPPPPQSPPIDTPEIAGQEVYNPQTQYPPNGQYQQGMPYPPNVAEMPGQTR